MGIFRFANPQYIYLLILVPVFILLYIFAVRRKKKMLERYGNLEIIAQLMPEVSYGRPSIKFILGILSFSVLILAIARPQFGSKLTEEKRKGIELIIALDVSNSMLAEDIKPNRLERAKQAISRMIDKMGDDKIGLIVFAGNAYTQIPITTDYSSAKMFLGSINTNIVPMQGTSISSAIKLASNSFTPDNKANKALIIITDGETHDENAIDLAKEASQKGIKIFTIGVGNPQGAPIPVFDENGNRTYRQDEEGKVIISKLNDELLSKIAIVGDGEFQLANTSNFGLTKIFTKLNAMNKEEISTRIYSEYEDQYQYLIGFALLLLLLDLLILEKKNLRLSNFKFFGNGK